MSILMYIIVVWLLCGIVAASKYIRLNMDNESIDKLFINSVCLMCFGIVGLIIAVVVDNTDYQDDV